MENGEELLDARRVVFGTVPVARVRKSTGSQGCKRVSGGAGI